MQTVTEKPKFHATLEGKASLLLGRHFLIGIMAVAAFQGVVAIVITAMPIHGGIDKNDIFNDVHIYYKFADRIFKGEVPYRDFTVEYPILALPLFLIPRFFVSSFKNYAFFWSVQILAVNAIGLWLAARWVAANAGMDRVPRCLAWYTLFFVLCNPVALARFDLAAMACAFGAVTYLMSGRPVVGGGLAASVVLMKLVPGVAAAPMFLKEVLDLRSSRLRGVMTAALVFAAGMAGWYVLGRGGVFDTFRYHFERSLEIGSLYTGLLKLVYKIQGLPLVFVKDHGAKHLNIPLAARIASLSIAFQLGAMLLALFAFWKAGMKDALRCSAACLAAFIVFGKILSPQFVVWLIPFVACLEGRAGTRAKWAYAICLVLNYLTYPWYYDHLHEMTHAAIGLLNARNLSLLVLFGLLAFDRNRDSISREDDLADPVRSRRDQAALRRRS